MPYKDEVFSCFNREDADRYISYFNIDVDSFGGKELCDSKVDFKKLINSISIIEKGQFETVENLFIRGFINPTKYYSWLIEQTNGMRRGQDLPWAKAYNHNGYFTMQNGFVNSSTLDRAGTLIHEARHTAGFIHIPCAQGVYKDSTIKGCDPSYEYGGSHAVEMEYYARVSVSGKNFHPVYKKMARHMAIARSNFLFNKPVIQPREALMALTAEKDQALLLANTSSTWLNREVPLNVKGQLKKTSFGASIFDGQNAYTIDPYQNSGFAEPISDDYSYLKVLKIIPGDRINDIEEFDIDSRRFSVKVDSNNNIQQFDFRNGAWSSLVSTNLNIVKTSTSILSKSDVGYYIIDDQQKIHEFNPLTNQISIVQGETWNTEYNKVVYYKNLKLVLKNNGSLWMLVQNQEIPWTLAPNQMLADIVSINLYDGFDVVKE